MGILWRLLLLWLVTVPLAARPHLEAGKTLRLDFHNCQLSPDGRQLVILLEQATTVVDVASGKTQARLPASFLEPVFSPDSKQLALFDGKKLHLFRNGRAVWHRQAEAGRLEFSGDGSLLAAFGQGPLQLFRSKDGVPLPLPGETLSQVGKQPWATWRGQRLLIWEGERGLLTGGGSKTVPINLGPEPELVRLLDQDRLLVSDGSAQLRLLCPGQKECSFCAPEGVHIGGLAFNAGRVLIHWTQHLGSDREALGSQLFSLSGKPLTGPWNRGFAYSSDEPPVCPQPVFVQGGIALASPNHLTFLDGQGRQRWTKNHPAWTGDLAALGPCFVSVGNDQLLRLWSAKGLIQTVRPGWAVSHQMLVRDRTLMVQSASQGWVKFYRLKD